MAGADGAIAAGSGAIGFSGAALVEGGTDGTPLSGICWIALTDGDGTTRGAKRGAGRSVAGLRGPCDVPERTRGTDLRPRAFPARRKEGTCGGLRPAGRRSRGDPFRTSTRFLGHSWAPRRAPRRRLREVTAYLR